VPQPAIVRQPIAILVTAQDVHIAERVESCPRIANTDLNSRATQLAVQQAYFPEGEGVALQSLGAADRVRFEAALALAVEQDGFLVLGEEGRGPRPSSRCTPKSTSRGLGRAAPLPVDSVVGLVDGHCVGGGWCCRWSGEGGEGDAGVELVLVEAGEGGLLVGESELLGDRSFE